MTQTMSDERPQHVYLPGPGHPHEPEAVPIEYSLVVVGANGTGKTRLGAWIETVGPQREQVHRVGAQRSLMMPTDITTTSLDLAEAKLLFGIQNRDQMNSVEDHPQTKQRMKLRRWGGKPWAGHNDDYGLLLEVLFAEHNDASVRYREAVKTGGAIPLPSETRLDRVKRVWEEALPHRKLILRGGGIEVTTNSSTATPYNAAEMSDGERVALYLIGQCLSASKNAIIVVDEPEIHLHRSVQSGLWDAIERERQDCLFIYLTHDLDFAASRAGATKIWLRQYEDKRWIWTIVPQTEGLPEEVMLAVLGSRRPVAFTEGDVGGLEYLVFGRVYPDWTILPRGGSEAVIAATTAFRALKHFHGLDCQGIIDRDFRTDEDAAYLKGCGVHVLDVHEVENLLLLPDVLRAIANHASEALLITEEPSVVVAQVTDFILLQLAQDKIRVASAATAWNIEKNLHRFNAKARGAPALREAVESAARSVNVETVYEAAEQAIDAAIEQRDLSAALRLYGNKGLIKQVGRFFGFANDAYPAVLLRLISSEPGSDMLQSLKMVVPRIDDPSPHIASPPLHPHRPNRDADAAIRQLPS